MKEDMNLISRIATYILLLGLKPETYLLLIIFNLLVGGWGVYLFFVAGEWSISHMKLLAIGIIVSSVVNTVVVLYAMIMTAYHDSEFAEKMGIEVCNDDDSGLR